MSSILFIDTDNAYLVILDLLTEEKRALLHLTASGPLAIRHLEALAERLAVVTRRGKPYATELAAADQRHDIGAVVLDHICRIHELLGALPEHARLTETARTIRGTLSMERSIISASYGHEAANAHRNRRLLAEIDELLRGVPVARDVTARDVAELFIGGGEQVGALLAKRAGALAEAQSVRAEAAGVNLLHEARDLLQRIRATLTGEVSMRDDLPADLVDRIFSVLDERIAVAAARTTRGPRTDDAALPDGEGEDATAAPALDLDGDGAADAAPDADPPAVRPLPRNG